MFTNMKKLIFLACLFYLNMASSQTIVIGAGANTTTTSENGDPIYNVLNNGVAFSQSVHVLNANDLASLPDFATITSFGFFKANANTLQAGRTANVKIYMKNTTNTALVEYKNFNSWIKDAKLVYSNANFSNANMPAAAGLVSFSCNNFVYLGGSIEIYIDWTRNGAVANFATGLFTWNYDNATVKKSVGRSSSNIQNNYFNCFTDFSRRYKTSLSFTAPTACTISSPYSTISTTTNPVYGEGFTLSLNKYQTGTNYQWYNSSGLIANAFGETYTTTANFVAETYYCKVDCLGGIIQNSTSISINPLQPISTFPFLETFDDNSPTVAGWKNTFTIEPSFSEWNSTVYNPFFYISPAASSKFMYLHVNSSNAIAIESPQIQLPATAPQYKELSYKYNISNPFFVQISVNGGAFSTLYNHDRSNSLFNTEYNKPWSTNTIGLNAYDGENIKIRFIGATTDVEFLAIDEVSIKDSPVPCSSAPDPPTIDLVSTNEANVYFAAVAGRTFVIEYGLSGFTPGTQTAAGVGGTVLTTSASPLLITALQVGQTYDVYIRERCPVAGFPGTFTCSNNSGVISFNTCQDTSVPYSENFETASVPGLAACTSGLNAGSGNLWDTQNAPGFGFTSNALRYNQNFTNNANAWFFIRAINLQAGVNYVIRYRYGISDQGWTEKLKVAYGSAATAAGMTLPLTDHPNISTTGLQSVSQVFTASTTGIYYFGFNCYSDAQQDQLFVDDISVVTEESTLPVATPIQNFCGNPNPQVSDLIATGINIKWYASLGTNVVMPQSITLNNGQTYYATQTIDGFESGRIAVQIFIKPLPTVNANQTVCSGKTLADLQVTGTNLKWYSAAIGGTLLPSTTVVSNGSYYVSQTIAGTGTCESTRTTVNVTLTTPIASTPIVINTCNTYQWSENGQTYNSSGIYTFVNENCEQKTLDLTIIPNTENINTISSCNSFTWTNNGQTYNQSGTYTGTTLNCVIQKLVLTIIPETENITNINTCSNYTWANTGQTYTQSGNYVGTTTGCVTERLNLILTPASESTVFETACGSYTWATNGQTYTTSGLYTSTTNCATQKLNLTIFPSTTSSLTVTACNAYAWPDTEDIITTSGIYTNTDNCETTTLNLTINQGPIITGDSNQNLNVNATLSNIIVNPANVVWYNNSEDALTGTSPLLNTQVVTNGTTYFAVANDGTCTSLPFAVSVTTTNLANENFELKDLKYYPNPTSNILNISNSEKITDVEVTNVLGQKLIIEKVNKNNYKLDLSGLPNATYFVKIKTFDKEKIVKVLKH